mmetsp:Transcript_4736/g.13717  ORF Transcript_4736/g.13717 Transcript_4736/m.13717 type:complete len:240 (-) Transcript_4736:569-1288(-)
MSTSAKTCWNSSASANPVASQRRRNSAMERIPFSSVSNSVKVTWSSCSLASSSCLASTPAQRWRRLLCWWKFFIAANVRCNIGFCISGDACPLASRGWASVAWALSRSAGSTSNKPRTKSLADSDTSSHSSASKLYSPRRMRCFTSAPKKGMLPQSSTKNRTPKAHMSIFSSHGRSCKTSGAVYKKVPTRAVNFAPRKIRHPKPKSISFTVIARPLSSPSLSTTKTFSGLMSRCTTPCA